MQTSPLLENLIESLRVLPGVGPKSAQRMAYHLLQRNRSGGMRLAQGLTEAMSKIGHCEHCRTFTEEAICPICNNPRRQNSGLLCVVEMPADILAIEQTGQFSWALFCAYGAFVAIGRHRPTGDRLGFIAKTFTNRILQGSNFGDKSHCRRRCYGELHCGIVFATKRQSQPHCPRHSGGR